MTADAKPEQICVNDSGTKAAADAGLTQACSADVPPAMTDEQLATYLGIPSDHPMKDTVIGALSPAKRSAFERMASIETELELWQAGLGPKPNVLIDTERGTRRRRAWR